MKIGYIIIYVMKDLEEVGEIVYYGLEDFFIVVMIFIGVFILMVFVYLLLVMFIIVIVLFMIYLVSWYGV